MEHARVGRELCGLSLGLFFGVDFCLDFFWCVDFCLDFFGGAYVSADFFLDFGLFIYFWSNFLNLLS